MAELPKNIRRPGGDLVSARQPFGRRVLLPTEADLCNLLGITEEEYWQFVEQVAAKSKERPKGYEHIPDIRSGPLLVYNAAGAAIGLSTLGQIVVGVALSVISYLLTPKPDTSRGSNRRTADIAGTRRFAPQFGFNSVQDLANLGDIIPLVFANYEIYEETTEDGVKTKPYGGVRVNSQLLWSQIISLGRYQQLKILGMFSLGELYEVPAFEGYAIGDLLLHNYNEQKINNTVDSNIPFIKKGNEVDKQKFKIDNKEWFSGTRNPTTQAIFGVSNPIPNATYFRLPYELLRISPSLDDDTVPPARDTLAKRRKNLGKWPARAGFMKVENIGSANETQVRLGNADIPKDAKIFYQVIGGPNNPKGGRAYQLDWKEKRGDDPGYMQHGVEDVNAISQTMREKADDDISFGEQYMLGTALVRCTSASEIPWENGTDNGDRSYEFTVLEKGRIQCTPLKPDPPYNHLGDHINNPDWYNNTGQYFELFGRDDKFFYEQYQNDLNNPTTTYTLQKAAIGTVSDNRNCDITEIGLKSKVFKQINFANVNSKPTEKALDDIYLGKSSLQLGNVNKYIKRYSFFKLQIRKAGLNPVPDWQYIVPDNDSASGHSGLFCVRGSSPEFQYNYIRIEHPKEQYEYRFLPWPGADVIKTIESNTSIKVSLLNCNNAIDDTKLKSFKDEIDENIVIHFAGNLELLLTREDLSNTEWNLGNSDTTDIEDPAYTGSTSRISTIGYIKSITPDQYSSSDDANELQWVGESQTQWTRFYGPQSTSVYREGNSGSYSTVSYGGENHTLILRSGLVFNLYINPDHVIDNEEQKDGPAWGNVVVGAYDEQPDSSVFGGGTTVTGVEFHYTNKATGKGGKYYPIIDPSISGSGQDSNDPGYGHPGGNPNLFYVRRQEIINVEAAQFTDEAGKQWKNEEVRLKDEDGNDTDAKIILNIWHQGNKSYAKWSYIANSGNNFTNGQKLTIPGVPLDPSENDPGSDEYAINDIQLTVNIENFDREFVEGIELNPYDAAADYWIFNGDQSSHLDGPEHEIVYCNEIVKDTGSTYNDLAYAALQIDSSKEWTNFSQFSAYLQKGIKVHRLIENSDGPTHLFPDIAYALLTDSTLGAGEIINTRSVNDADMKEAAKFCKANRYFWDGMISNKVNLREFIFEQATYCLLDFTIIGGKFSLKPSVPYKAKDEDGEYTIDTNQVVKIKALFTDGNINELNVSYFAPEDRQTFQANILYRLEKLNGFTETKSVVVKLKGRDNDPVETFDLSGFCTSEKHAKDFGKYVISAKEEITHLITFKTAPHYVEGLQPGDYIRVYSTTQHTDRFKNGAILDGGKVVSRDTITGSNDIYYWNSSKTEVDFAAGVNFNSSSALAAYAGSLFTIRTTDKTNQCYKVESITFGDDGLIELAATHTPLISMKIDSNGNYVDDKDGQYGRLAILDEWDTGVRFDYVTTNS